MLTEENRELIIKWVEALESGEWKQVRNVLYSQYPRGPDTIETATSFCCIGVLGRLKGMTGKVVTCEVSTKDLFNDGTRGDLINMNDRDLRSFKEIAAYIRQHVLGE